jgi:hypothetical protein
MLKFSAAKRRLLSALVLIMLMVFLVSISFSLGATSQAGVSDHPAAVIACVADDPGSSGGGCGGG